MNLKYQVINIIILHMQNEKVGVDDEKFQC